MVAFLLFIFEDPKKTTFLGECFEPEFILDLRHTYNTTIIEKNLNSDDCLIQGFDPSVFDSSTVIPQLLKRHVLGISERLQCCITMLLVFETESFVLGHCLNLMQPEHINNEHVEIFIMDNTSSVMCESYQQYPPWDLTTVIELRTDRCILDRFSFNEVTIFDTYVIGWPCFHSKNAYILHASNTVTPLHNQRSGWIILLQTQLTNVVVDASCSKVDKDLLFFSYLQSGQAYLIHVNRNITNMFGKNNAKVAKRFTDAKNNSVSLVLDISSTVLQIPQDASLFTCNSTGLTILYSSYFQRKQMLSCPHFMPLRMYFIAYSYIPVC